MSYNQNNRNRRSQNNQQYPQYADGRAYQYQQQYPPQYRQFQRPYAYGGYGQYPPQQFQYRQYVTAMQQPTIPKEKQKKRSRLVITSAKDGSVIEPPAEAKVAETDKKQETATVASPNGETGSNSSTESTTDKKAASSDAASTTAEEPKTDSQTSGTKTKPPSLAAKVENSVAPEQPKVDTKQHVESAEPKQQKKDDVPVAKEDPKKTLAPLQTNIDDVLDNINSPIVPIATPKTPGNFSLTDLENIRKTCAQLETPTSWPVLEVVNAVSSGRQRDSRDSRNRDPRRDQPRRSYNDGNQRRQHSNAPPRQWERGVRQQSPRDNYRKQQPFNPRERYKLPKTANGWSRDKHEAKKAQDNLAKIKTACNSLFNKLSVDNFERLLGKFMEMEIQTRPQLIAAVAIIFDKALTMPTFCHLYARFCGEVKVQEQVFIKKIVKVLEEEHDGEKVYFYDVGDDTRVEGREGPYPDSATAREKGEKACTFKRVLLTQCQEVFESHDSWENAFNEQLNDKSLSEKAKEKAKEEAELYRLKVKRRSLGIVQFVAHLYLNSLLSEKRVFNCMHDLLLRCNKELTAEPKPITEGVEVFAKIITEVGKKIDNGGPNSKSVMDAYMQQLNRIIKTKGLDSRTRFMIMDVIDLREKLNWVPRRKKAKMVTKAQFKKEAEEKLREESRRNNRRGGNSRNQRGYSRH